MLKRWDKKLEIFAPIERATRCLDQWLKEEGKALSRAKKRRAAALMARYFQHEDDLNDALMLSFLRHYSGRGDVDMEDPTSVRMEIKAVLDGAREGAGGRGAAFFIVVGALLMALAFSGWELGHRKITPAQQAELKELVHDIAELDPATTSAGIWADVKEPLKVRSYQDITLWDFAASRDMLKTRHDALLRKKSTVVRPGM